MTTTKHDYAQQLIPIILYKTFAMQQPFAVQQYTPQFWKMNIIAAHDPYLFIATERSILCFTVNKYPCSATMQFSQQQILKLTHTVATSQVINQIRAYQDYLLVVCDSGHVCLYEIVHGKQILQLVTQFVNTDSTWSLAMHQQTIAVGANSHRVTLYHVPAQKRHDLVHDHNVPCVDFSPCGNFVASACIDRCVRVWRANADEKEATSTVPLAKATPNTEWGWGVRWIPATSVKMVPSSNKDVWKAVAYPNNLLASMDDDHEEFVSN